MGKDTVMVLTQVQSGGEYTIHAITAEGEVRHHLEGMGFVPGTRLAVISRIGDALIVNLRGSKVALDPSLARCVLV